ncbi:MAG: DNA gyrase subunit A, partial [Polyangiales bacterium]
RATRDPLLSAYATLVDMAAPFRTRVPLVEGRGNFGTQHGDPPADHMYTECRLSPWGAAVLGGAPNLLVNGARADASRVFHFLPHNLGEVVDALVECVQSARPRTLVPDLPCGGVVDEAELEALAHTGQGKLRVRARMRQENVDGVPLVVLTEAPQDVDLEEIILGASKAIRAGLVRSVRDLRDESTREGLRIVFVGERGANPDEIEAALHAHTCSTLEVDGMALCDGTERCMSTADLLKETARRLSSRPAMVEELRALAAAHTTPRRTSTARFA